MEADFIWQLEGQDAVEDKTRQLIREAGATVLASLWQTEFDSFYDELQAAEQRGVRLALVHFRSPARRLGATFHHPVEETIRLERGGRGLTLVVDQRCVVIATHFDDGRVEGTWSRNRAFVFVAEDFVRHDVYITKVTATMDDDLKGTLRRRLRKAA